MKSGLMILTLLAALPLPALGSNLPHKPSSLFTHCYEATTAAPPVENPDDWTLYSASPTTNSISEGVLNASFGRDQLWISTPEADTALDHAAGWTYEVRLKVLSDSGNRGSVAMGVDDQESGGGLNGFQIHDSYIVWCNDGATADTSSNSDGFHVFRLAEEADSGTVHGWRDGVYLGTASSPFNFGGTLAKTVLFGSWSTAIVGTVEIDYIRWDSTGAFGPALVVVQETGEGTLVNEEGPTSDTYTLSLAEAPTDDVTITVTPGSDDIDLSAGPGQPLLMQWTSSQWDQIRTVTVEAVDDNLSEGIQTVTITHVVSSADSRFDGTLVQDTQVTVEDNEPYCGDKNTVYLSTDFNRDCYVNLVDFSILASEWLQCTDPSDFICYPNIPPEPMFETTVFTSTGIVGGTTEDPAHTHRIPALICTSSGTLIAVSDARVNNSGDLPNNIDVSIRRSFDNGTTWTPLEIIVDYPGSEGAGDPCILIDRQHSPETIFIFYLYGPGGIGLFQSQPGLDGPSTCRVEYVKSTDDGATWSSPVDINPMVKNPDWGCALASPGSGLQMRNGTLVVPGYYRVTNGTMYSYFFYSTDHGTTWQNSQAPGAQQSSASTTECAVVELNDGSLMLNMRNHRGTGCRAVSTTPDMGQTWSPIIDETQLPDPVNQATLIRISDTRDGDDQDRFLFANAANSGSRTNGTVRISYDQGQTWPVSKQIYAGSYAYSCLAVLNDGNIGLLYEADGYSRIGFARFSVKWLSDNKDWFIPDF